jgi:ATP-dependent Clp endopeptidase proteolytic subunit ClpP
MTMMSELGMDVTPDPALTQALIKKVEAQTAGQLLDNSLAESLSTTAKLATEKEVLRAQWEAAAPAMHRIFYLAGEIDENAAGRLIDVLSRWDRMDLEAGKPDRGYTVVITSPGGEVTSGFQVYSYLKGLAERRQLTISAAGQCASMATILHQAASPGRRFIEPGCMYLLHEVSAKLGGRSDSVIDTTDWLRHVNSVMHKIFAERGTKTEEEIATAISRRERFLSVEEVIEWGLADQVGYVS